jgi:Clp amino terminal domain, pathogenicity island component
MRVLFRRPAEPPPTRPAEAFLIAAAAAARRLGHGYVGTEHLLLALAEAGQLAGLRAADIEAEIVARVGAPPAPPEALDAGALAALGIDLDEVRRRVDEAFGAGTLQRAAEPCLRMTPRLKAVLARAVARAGEGPVGEGDVLDALRSTDCLAARILAARAG